MSTVDVIATHIVRDPHLETDDTYVFVRIRTETEGGVVYHRTSFKLDGHNREVTEVEAHLSRLGRGTVPDSEKSRAGATLR